MLKIEIVATRPGRRVPVAVRRGAAGSAWLGPPAASPADRSFDRRKGPPCSGPDLCSTAWKRNPVMGCRFRLR